jgi:hypothetical protein
MDERMAATRAKSEANRASPRVINLQIVDEAGAAIARAATSSIQYSIKLQTGREEIVATDTSGAAIHRVPPYFAARDIYVDLNEEAKVAGWTAYKVHLEQQDFLRYEPLAQSFRLTLPLVRHPIPLKAKLEVLSHRRVNDPKDGLPVDPRLPDLAVTEIGYDAELLEPMPPHGNGKRVDFIVKITSTFLGFKDAWTRRSAEVDVETRTRTFDEGKVRYGNWTHSVTYRFPNTGDGVLLSPQFWPYCKLKMPHKAPEDGYAQEITLTETQDNSGIRPDLAHCREHMVNNGLYLRVRTQLDKDGNVVSANYAKIVEPQGSGFDIFYNPTPNDRNLEYDLKTNLRWQELHPLSKEPELWDRTYRLLSN